MFLGGRRGLQSNLMENDALPPSLKAGTHQRSSGTWERGYLVGESEIRVSGREKGDL